MGVREEARKKAAAILDKLEDLLEENDITVPCDEFDEAERRKTEGAARLFAGPYYELEDELTNILNNEGDVCAVMAEIREQLDGKGVSLLELDGDARQRLAEDIDYII